MSPQDLCGEWFEDEVYKVFQVGGVLLRAFGCKGAGRRLLSFCSFYIGQATTKYSPQEERIGIFFINLHKQPLEPVV